MHNYEQFEAMLRGHSTEERIQLGHNMVNGLELMIDGLMSRVHDQELAECRACVAMASNQLRCVFESLK